MQKSSFLKFRTLLLFIFLFELLSIFAWADARANLALASLISLTAFLLSLKKLRYGIYLAAVELIIGSHGYLFSFNLNDGGLLISVRMGIFAAVMLAFVIHVLRQGLKNYWLDLKKFPLIKYYFALAGVILWGLIWGILRNEFSNVFFDFNNWLFFLYLLPLISITKGRDEAMPRLYTELTQIISAALAWLIVKIMLLLYIFSHQFIWALPEIYQWVRDTRVGEITQFSNNFYRIFIQSQIYALLAFFIFLPISKQFQIRNFLKTCNLKLTAYCLLLTACLTTVIISFSRSFWLGLIAGLLAYCLLLIVYCKKQIIPQIFKLFLITLLSVGIIFVIINAPPGISGASLGSLISERTTVIEAAGNSRLNMLKPLMAAIIKHPLIGSGFGAAVTYRSLDPRVLSATAGASGEYTTYAFEWGYLDLLLKFGLLGVFIYLLLIFKLLRIFWRQVKSKIKNSNNQNNLQVTDYELRITNYELWNAKLHLGFLLALLVLLAVNFFTPYLNHPLGIGFILISSLLASRRSIIKNNRLEF